MGSIDSVFILAAGRGERLKPLTDKTPKPLIEVRGKTLLEHNLEKLQGLSLKRVVINVWHLGEQIEAFVKNRGHQYDFEILISKEEELLGTGGGLKKALPLLGEAPFLMMNSDCLWRANLAHFIEESVGATGFEAVWALTEKRESETEIFIDAQNSVVKLGSFWEESADQAVGSGCFSGFQVFREIHPSFLPDQGCIIRDYWLQRLQQRSCLSAVLGVLDEWEDLGTLERLEKFQK